MSFQAEVSAVFVVVLSGPFAFLLQKEGSCGDSAYTGMEKRKEIIIGIPCRAAVEQMTALGVLDGFPDGSFQPEGTLTREQDTKIVTCMSLGSYVRAWRLKTNDNSGRKKEPPAGTPAGTEDAAVPR